MGSGSRRRQDFFATHRLCCFCGGGRSTEEIDHVPSRVLFKERKWPEGFEFPACVRCNRATALDEQVVAMLALASAGTTQPIAPAEVEARIRAVANNHPAVLQEMQPTVVQVREAGRRYGLTPAPGQTHRDLPLLSVRGPLVNAAVDNFGRKLGCALFYKHAGHIAPPEAAIAVRWYSNLQIQNDEVPPELAGVLVGLPTLQRAGTSLNDQFFYRWAVTDTQAMGAFLAFLRRSFAILVFVNASKDLSGVPGGANLLHPYAWA
jgi:hypothetical protein